MKQKLAVSRRTVNSVTSIGVSSVWPSPKIRSAKIRCEEEEALHEVRKAEMQMVCKRDRIQCRRQKPRATKTTWR